MQDVGLELFADKAGTEKWYKGGTTRCLGIAAAEPGTDAFVTVLRDASRSKKGRRKGKPGHPGDPGTSKAQTQKAASQQ